MQNGSKQFADKIIFQDCQFAINEGEHVGVIGPNGAGKSTLFKVLVEQESLDSGIVTKSSQLRIGYLEQESDWNIDLTSEDYLAKNCIKPLWELKKIGLDLGLRMVHFTSHLSELSGGYRMRMKLLYLIGMEPNLMLLDEPTNFLDLESILALEQFLQSYTGAFLLISHDREFLRRTTESTLEVEGGEITKFPGHIDDYFEQKAQLRTILESQAANQESKRKSIQDFVDRFKAKATKARQAQSRMKLLDKMEQIEIKSLPVKARIKIPPPIHTGKETLSISNGQLGYEKNCILKNVNLRIERGTHLGVVGFNGAGKSTLLKSLADKLPLIAGDLKFGYQVSLSYYSQHSKDQLDSSDTVLTALQSAAHKEITAQEILNMAGSLLFSGDDVHKKVKVLSGGEKSRVALGQVLLKKSPLLLLDEPTNHLDFETVETLTEAIREFEGSVIVVSHDRGFIGRVASQILEIANGQVETYPGSYDEYLWSLQNGALRARSENSTQTQGEYQNPNTKNEQPSGEKFNYKNHSKKLTNEIKDLQKKITACEAVILDTTKKRDQFMQELLKAQGFQAQTLSKDLNSASIKIETLEEELMSLLELTDSKEKELKTFVQENTKA